jgi:hypothetical protein
LLGAVHDGFAAHAIQVAVVAVEFGRAGDAQPIAGIGRWMPSGAA